MSVAAISYNMSVFSAMGYAGNLVKIGMGAPRNRLAAGMPPFPSEARFLRRAKQEKDLQTGLTVTDFFMNAVNHLHTNVEEMNKKTPVVMIGIQEFYPPTGPTILRGPLASYSSWVFNSDGAASWKDTTVNNYANKYGQKVKGIPNDASMLTLWHEKLGPMVNHYDKDLGEGGAPADGGRPISIILTEKGYVLVNFHGINRPRFSPGPSTDGTLSNKDNAAELKALVSARIGEAMAKFKAENPTVVIDNKKIIITCDANDRTHSFGKGGNFTIDGTEFHDGHLAGVGADGLPTSGALACCYNYDSVGLPFPKSSTVRNGVNANVEPGVPQTMGMAGAEAKYVYTGDYILAAEGVVTPVVAVPSPQDEEGASVASDHMMVYAILNMPLQGGKRRKTRKQKKSKGKKQTR
uniref:Endonuclease/exonuclease/phosphatase domain-containing protein n=1 Tax=viral metagenome TaxID=1070528 RepID=A0A6C0BC25_9ZZZZ